MGTGHSKIHPVSYEEAVKRVSPKVLSRLEQTFRLLSTSNGYLPQLTFSREVLGDGVPAKLAEALYQAFGGSQKGLTFKDLISGLALIIHGKKTEKAQFIGILVSDDGESITRSRLEELISACDASPALGSLSSLFGADQSCSMEAFQKWIINNAEVASFSRWLLVEEQTGLDLDGEPEPLTFHQTLAQKYKVSEKVVMDVEKTYWALKGSDKFDLETFQCYISPPLPEEMVPALFRIMDINNDGHLDFSEVLNAVSIWCSEDYETVQRFCFKVFDMDSDGFLSREELVSAMSHLKSLREQNTLLQPALVNGSVSGRTEPPEGAGGRTEPPEGAGGRTEPPEGTGEVSLEEGTTAGAAGVVSSNQGEEESLACDETVGESAEDIADSALKSYGNTKENFLSADEYVVWAREHSVLARQIPTLLFEISHIRLGICPKSKEDEAKVVGGYLLRFAKRVRVPGEVVYVTSADWFRSWVEYTGYQGHYPALVSLSGSGHRKHRKKTKRSKNTPLADSSVTPPPAPPPSSDSVHVETGEEVMEMIEADEVTQPTSDARTHRGSGISNVSEASILSKGDALRPPPVSNADLCIPERPGVKKLPSLTNEGARMRSDKLLVVEKDFVLLPEVIWKVFVSWYSSSAYNIIPALPRTIGEDGKVDLYPVFFKLFRHTTVPPSVKPSSLPWPLSSLMHSLGLGSSGPPTPSPPTMVSAGGEGGELPQAPIPRRVPTYVASFVKTTTIAEMSEKVRQVLHIKPEDLRVYDLSNENSPVLLEDEAMTVQDLEQQLLKSQQKSGGPKEGYRLLVETRNKDNTWPEEMIALVKEVQEKDKDKQKTQPQQKSIQVQSGATGLSNLGNTCFMNSALQCVSNAKFLTEYFQNNDHLLEINKDNPLGMQGTMAKRYGELIHDLWSGNAKSITPLKFRFTVGRCAPHFTGFQQQDAQELLAFVLDGLHEDLNRVKKKPYIELKDSDGRPDEEVAREAWDYHLSRNRSIIVDLFHGQLKSEVTCKTCNYKSVRFDPFTFLSLPLPMESTINLEITVMFLDGRQPVKFGLKLEIDDKYRELKEELGNLCGIPASRLLLVEMYSSNIKSWPSDTTKIRSVLGGWLYAYELPSPPPVPTTRRSDSPDEMARREKLERVNRERTLSMKKVEGTRLVAASVREKLARDPLRGGDSGVEEVKKEEEVENVAKRRRVIIEVREQGEVESTLEEMERGHDHSEVGVARGRGNSDVDGAERMDLEDSDQFSNTEQHRSIQNSTLETYIFAIHRRTYSVENFLVAQQKTRPMLFSIPLVVPCTYATLRQDLYASVWAQVQRLIIPDPPNSDEEATNSSSAYPFVIKQVTSDGMNCSSCPWYRFCRGCTIPCDSQCVGDVGRFVGIDWDPTTLHLKYLMAQEKAHEHESMESLKIIDTQPIDLYKCFKAFVREDQLGDEESWYCKKCKTHREAVKSLEIWRFPPILIIHLKRFQFVNGRWVKSQRAVTFPLQDLDPLRYTVRNGNGISESETGNGTSVESTEAGRDREEESSDSDGIREARLIGNGGMSLNDTLAKRDECVTSVRRGLSSSGGASDDDDDDDGGVGGEGVVMVDGSDEGAATRGGGGEEEGKKEGEEADDRSGDERRGSHTPKLYNLFAISCHTGVLGGGHYTSFAKNVNGTWYYFNDSSCKETTPERVEQESPYMLFYELQNIADFANQFQAAEKQGVQPDTSATEDDRDYDETIKNIKKNNCSLQ